MAQYIDVTNLPNFEVTCSNGKKYILLPYEHLSDIPTADVAPRADYEAVIAGQETLQKYIAKVKAEVAREIFEDIEKRLLNHIADYYGCYHETFDELKKKYTDVPESPKGD